MAGSHGGSRRWRRLRSVAGGETEERGGGRSRERGRSERGSGLRGVAGGTREGGGSQAGRRWPGRVAARAGRVPVLLAEEEGDRGGAGGLGRPGGGELGRLVAPGKLGFSLLFCFIFLFSILFSFLFL